VAQGLEGGADLDADLAEGGLPLGAGLVLQGLALAADAVAEAAVVKRNRQHQLGLPAPGRRDRRLGLAEGLGHGDEGGGVEDPVIAAQVVGGGEAGLEGPHVGAGLARLLDGPVGGGRHGQDHLGAGVHQVVLGQQQGQGALGADQGACSVLTWASFPRSSCSARASSMALPRPPERRVWAYW
jgi:hypothetical protein